MKTDAVKPIGFVLRAYTKKELRTIYGIPKDTFQRWLKDIPELTSSGRKNWLSIIQVQAILTVHGVPGEREFN